MKRYEAVMGKYAGLPYIETNQHSEGRFVLYSEAQAEIKTIKNQLNNTVLDASSLIEKVLYWAEVVHRNPDVSRDELLTMIADTKQQALIIHGLIEKVKL